MWDEVQRRLDVDIQAALFTRAMGGEVEVPDPAAVRARFDELLCAEPAGVGVATRTQILREAFGLSGG